MNSSKAEKGNPVLWRLYWSLILRDILFKLGYDSTRKNKDILHELHKRVTEYHSTAGLSHEDMSHFIFLVVVFWAQHGIFVRTKKDQPIDIEERSLEECLKKGWL